MRLYTRRIARTLIVCLFVYFSAVGLAHRNYWAGLFWGTYLSWIPVCDILDGFQR